MDTFGIIQHFFTRMECNFCQEAFEPEDVELVGEGDGMYIVSVHCHHCGRHNGVAAVGVESAPHSRAIQDAKRFKDPEFTDDDRQRLAQSPVIDEDAVLEAHEFIQSMGADWQRFIPEEIRQRYTTPDTESIPPQ